MTSLTLGSLFDGSGGFPLAGKIVGITPVWASEIEPFPIRITTKRIPEMKHYGDVRKMNGDEIEPVDIITFGSPCQDLSVAGKRSGLEGKQSGLFYEAVRIIKEMRQETNGKYPRFAVWENVPGSLSSNKGEDFRAVLEALCSIKESVYVPRPKRWTSAGEIVGNEFSLAWRILDAQYWGVPQRRRRIFLVVDFGSNCASEILFERQGVCGRAEKSNRAWKKFTRRVGNCFEISGIGLESHSQDSRITIVKNKKISTLTGNMGTGGNNGPLVMVAGWSWQNSLKTNGPSYQKELSPTIRAFTVPSVACSFCCENDPLVQHETQPLIADSRAIIRRLTPLECCRLQGFPDYWCDDLNTDDPTEEELKFWNSVFETIKKGKTEKQLLKWLKNPRSDMAEYKMWGNGIALPCAVFVLFGIVCLVKQSQN